MDNLRRILYKPSATVQLPSFHVIIKSILQKVNLARTADQWLRKEDKYIWLSRSTYSLSLISELRIKYSSDDSINVFLPDYFCNQSLTLIRRNNINLFFYNVDSELKPVKPSIEKLLKKIIPDIIVQVHYFGKVADTNYLRDVSDVCGSWFVEDATHIMLPISSVGLKGDFVLYSQYKHLPVPEGALLVFHNPDLYNEPYISEILKRIDSANPNIHKESKFIFLFKWILKRIIQSTFFPIRRTFRPTISGTSNLFFSSGASISQLALKLISNSIYTIQQDIEYKLLIARKLESSFNLDDIDQKEKQSFEIPYMLRIPINSKSIDNNFLINKLVNSNLPYLKWPDLPPEVSSNQEDHIDANLMFQFNLFIPIHRSISIIDVNTIILEYQIYLNSM